jgi:valyl-tRNA synthetase
MTELPKTFDPAAIEAKWYAHWESTGAFRPKPTPENPRTVPYTIVNPPPNVTGSLHIGHALDNTLQDILIRHARLQGKDALWVVGTDHAGIATQMVVERQMALHQQKRTDFSRDEFVKKVWEWKNESGGEITQQLRRLGCSMDWSREQFTMSPEFSKAVTKVFVDLYTNKDEDGNPAPLIYRDKRLVNWDPGLKTAISDLEVETVEVNGKFWHFKYPLADGSGHISVATTRPETMLADMAVAVSPGDPRYAAMVGKMVKLPITGRLIPIIEDEHADPELGSGAVKITPGHDFNDFEVGKRAGFKPAEMLNMLDAEAKVVQCGDIPEALLGLSVADARKEVVALIEAAGLLEKVEDRVIQTPFGDRSGVVIEPWLTDQWYVDAKTLAGPAIEAVRSGAIEVVPKSWEKTYFNWMENIQPWCVSRQLWWGHRIPAWYGPKADHGGSGLSSSWGFADHVFVADTEGAMIEQARAYYPLGTEITVVDAADAFLAEGSLGIQNGKVALFRDPDVLDTWFSSALWPFGTLGWPEGTDSPSPPAGEGGALAPGEGAAASAAQATLSPESESQSHGAQTRAAPSLQPLPREGGEASLLTRHYPGDVLVSGFDILFFWDARMIMQGLHFTKEVPFRTLYLHGLVRAADGSKMSKSKGNTVDPLGLIDQYGADALRFFMAAMESQGRDIKMDEERVKGYRNFATKLWNAARFAQANGIGASQSVEAPKAGLAVNKWIIGEVVETLDKLNKAFEEFRFDAMADAIYHFAWGTFCDWYLELIKPVLSTVIPAQAGTQPPTKDSSDEVLGPGLRRDDDAEQTETRAVAGWVFDQILVMLHPFMPFITEELWEAMGDRGGHLIIHAKWPEPEADAESEAKAEIEWLVRLVSEIRSVRTERNVPPSAKLRCVVWADADKATVDRVKKNETTLERMARISEVSYTNVGLAGDVAQLVVDGTTYALPLEGTVDTTAERTRLTAAITAITKERDSLAGRLNNPAFVEKAKPEAEKAAEVERLTAAIARLG